MWLWIGIGLGVFFVMSVLAGAALAAMLGTISRGISEMHEAVFEAEAWTVRPPSPRRRGRPRRRHLELELHP